MEAVWAAAEADTWAEVGDKAKIKLKNFSNLCYPNLLGTNLGEQPGHNHGLC